MFSSNKNCSLQSFAILGVSGARQYSARSGKDRDVFTRLTDRYGFSSFRIVTDTGSFCPCVRTCVRTCVGTFNVRWEQEIAY